MALALFALIGCAVGYWLGMSRAGYITLALTAVGSAFGQLGLILATQSREALTMLPTVMGVVLTLFMLIGAVIRLAMYGRPKA